ncbi:MAG TPA: xanthine dehydrogenase family protein subunit M [Chloroflexi bacterium]|nr:xanthine dehydrogenase family protein subunit M [Chloroflexota bacterium]
MWDDYLFPQSVDEALQMLDAHGGQARIIAGGTDLALQSQRGRVEAMVMVDITRIPGLDQIEEREGYVYIGAQATHARVATSPLVRARGRVLAEACASVGGPQIRNVGTLVGNVMNALPAADGAIALTALDAEAEVADHEGRRWIPLGQLYAGVGRSTVDSTRALVTRLRFPALTSNDSSAFERLAKRKALILPILNTGVTLRMDNGSVREARIAIGPVATTPFVAAEAAQSLVGRAPDARTIAEAARLASQAAQPRYSLLRGTAEYRKAMVEVLVRRALSRAAAQISGAEGEHANS